MQNLRTYAAINFSRGKPAAIEAIWIVIQALFFSSFLPGSFHRRALLKIFGAKVGKGVIFKSYITVKFPWKLEIKDFAWIGERVWIDNIEQVTIGSNVCISQDAYICTGNHDWSSPTFDLIAKPISIGNGVWIAARSTVGPGVTVGQGSVLALGSTTNKDLEPWGIYSGVPATYLKQRVMRPSD